MRLFATLAVAVSLASAQTPEALDIVSAKLELERVERLIKEGGLAATKLQEAKATLAEAEDRAVIAKALYGSIKIEQLTEDVSNNMLAAAKRLLDRQQDRVSHQRRLVEEGLLPRLSLSPHLDELDARRRVYEDAQGRVRFWNELVAMARAEEARQAALEAEQIAAMKAAEENPGYGTISTGQYKRLESEFNKAFGRLLPVSAKGDTALHRSLGFNHIGRMDVAISPDSAEGKWLRTWLEGAAVPFLAFRAAIPGQATGAHIHIGSPSPRIRIAD